ncbi:MAG TPA: sulfur carrier protein ThiS [Actinomycetospora sp.]|uniref:sulfur carrier protein ThiS n=1 Tax=Actinomycetospora sp. TaxID=1872135 RepID=UPI002F3F0D58
MTVLLNGAVIEVAPDATVADVLAAHGVPDRGVAVALSGEVVPRAAWASTRLREGAVLEVLTAVQGG